MRLYPPSRWTEVAGIALGLLAVALPAAGVAWWLRRPPLDGLEAELAAAQRLADGAEAYYAMTAATREEADASTRVVRALAAAWQREFGIAVQGTPQLDQALLAFVVAAACAITFELSGRSLLAPTAALSLAALDLYLLRPNKEQNQASASLSDDFSPVA